MGRTSRWSKIQKTFADHSTSTPIRKTRHDRSAEIVQSNSEDYHIEDSDEENHVQSNTECSRIKSTEHIAATKPTVLRRKRQRSLVPLSISVSSASININRAVDTWNDDSDDSLVPSDDANLTDVSVIRKSTSNRKRSKNITSALNITTPKATPNGLSRIASTEDIKSNNDERSQMNTTIKGRLSTFRHTFNGRPADSAHHPDEIIADSDCDEANSVDANATPKSGRECFFSLSVDESDRATQTAQIDTESTQNSLRLPSQQSPLLARPTARAKKCIKDGMVQQWHRVVNKSRSEHSFWMNDRLADLTEAGERFTVDRIEESYGRVLLHCSNASNERKIICLDSEHRKFATIKVGRTIELLPETAGYQLEDGLVFYPYINKIFY